MIQTFSRYKLERLTVFVMFLLLPLMGFFEIPFKYVIISLIFIAVYIHYFLRYSLFRGIAFSKPLFVWFVLTLYHWFNAMYNKVPEVDAYDLLHGLKIYVCIVFFVYIVSKDFDKSIFTLIVVFLSLLLMSFVLNTKTPDNRLSGVLYSTGLGQRAALTGVYIAYYCVTNKISVIKSSVFYIVPLIVILSTQSRNALAMIFIIIIGHLLANNLKKGLKIGRLFIVLLILGLISFQIVTFIMEHTDIGQRFAALNTLDQSQKVNNIATGTFFDTLVGDRLRYYVVGFQLFIESPFTGIGMWNFKYEAGGIYPLHSEYMVHLCEGGLIGFLIWFYFIYLVIKGVLKSNKPIFIKLIALFSMFSILFCGIYGRLFYYEYFYPVIAIALSLSPTIESKTKIHSV